MHALFRLIRPRTLPLAIAAVCCGNAIAWHSSPASWRGSVFLLSLLTALTLQIVSNIANDYGDGIRGTDRHRAPDAPERLTASGQIPLPHIRRLLAASVLAALLLGSTLIALSLRHPQQWLAFLLLGSLALAAALTYTLGRHAYGYHGLGEISVFLFFGLLGVQGSAYLQQGSCPPEGWLPAAGSGLLAAAVLHINNIRDIRSDRAAGKRTLANLLGFAAAKRLHTALAAGGLLCYAAYGLLHPAALGFLVCLPQAAGHLARVRRAPDCAAAGRELPAAVILHTLTTLGLSAGLFCAAWTGWQAA